MNPVIRKIFLVAFFIFTINIAGCTTLGPIYQKVDKIPENSGLVYIYQRVSFDGEDIDLYTNSGKTYITEIYNGGYFPYFAKPGEVDFSAATAESESSITLDIVPGQIYYLKLRFRKGFFFRRPHLIVVPLEVGEKEIAECKLIPKEN